MLNMEVNYGSGIFQGFDMEKFFDKESLMDVMYTLNKEAKICYKGLQAMVQTKRIH